MRVIALAVPKSQLAGGGIDAHDFRTVKERIANRSAVQGLAQTMSQHCLEGRPQRLHEIEPTVWSSSVSEEVLGNSHEAGQEVGRTVCRLACVQHSRTQPRERGIPLFVGAPNREAPADRARRARKLSQRTIGVGQGGARGAFGAKQLGFGEAKRSQCRAKVCLRVLLGRNAGRADLLLHRREFCVGFSERLLGCPDGPVGFA